MTQYVKLFTVTGAISVLMIFGCGKKQSQIPVPRDPNLAISCIAVMPVQPAVDYESALSFAQVKQLKDGAGVFDVLLKKQFAGRADVRFVTSGQVYGIENGSAASPLSRLRLVAEQLSCNAVLEVSLSRYTDRIGGEYTAKEPASVAFQYRLYEVGEGRILCHGRFDEVQQSLMENLYNWNRASNRGFTWITAEELMAEGIQEKFSQCSYLFD